MLRDEPPAVAGSGPVRRQEFGRARLRPGIARLFGSECANVVVCDLGMPVAGFSVNGDAGATMSAGDVERMLLAVSDGDIVLAHMNRPGSGTAAGCARAIPRLIDAGVEFVGLDPTAA